MSYSRKNSIHYNYLTRVSDSSVEEYFQILSKEIKKTAENFFFDISHIYDDSYKLIVEDIFNYNINKILAKNSCSTRIYAKVFSVDSTYTLLISFFKTSYPDSSDIDTIFQGQIYKINTVLKNNLDIVRRNQR